MKKAFPGFQKNMKYTPLPNVFFGQLLAEMDDIAEIKVILYVFQSLYEKRGYPKYVTDSELLSDRGIVKGVGDADSVRRGLSLAADHGALIQLEMEMDGRPVTLYFLNSESDREARAKIENGEIELGALSKREAVADAADAPNIFLLYEQNIGMLTPMIADELKDAEKIYPVSWIEEAFREAVDRNKRSWRYIESILKRWASEGRGYGESGKDSKQDPDKYVKGKYGHIVRR